MYLVLLAQAHKLTLEVRGRAQGQSPADGVLHRQVLHSVCAAALHSIACFVVRMRVRAHFLLRSHIHSGNSVLAAASGLASDMCILADETRLCKV